MRMDLLEWLMLAALLAASVGLLRRWPLAGLALLLASSPLEGMLLEPSREIKFVPILLTGLAVCFIAATHTRLISAAAAAMSLVLAAAHWMLLLGNDSVTVVQVVGNYSPAVLLAVVAVTVIAWLAGHSIRQAHINAERLRAQAQAQAATNERLRIARELHDMVAHSIGVIAIQAGAGCRVIGTQPAQARNALDAIETTSRETLADLRRMLTALRQAGPADDTVPSPLDPAPGLAGLGRLAAATRDAGVRVDVRWQGQRRPLPACSRSSAPPTGSISSSRPTKRAWCHRPLRRPPLPCHSPVLADSDPWRSTWFVLTACTRTLPTRMRRSPRAAR